MLICHSPKTSLVYMGQRRGGRPASWYLWCMLRMPKSWVFWITDWSCYDCSFLFRKWGNPLGRGFACFALGFDLSMHFADSSLVTGPESPAAAQVSFNFMRKWPVIEKKKKKGTLMFGVLFKEVTGHHWPANEHIHIYIPSYLLPYSSTYSFS